jgi:hypothetical protein
MRSLASLPVLVLVALGACDAGYTTPAAPAPVRTICDGSEGLRLGHTSEPNGPARSRSYLFVDGHCRYWVSSSGGDASYTGVLDAAQEQHLVNVLEFQRWPVFADIAGCPPPGTGWTSSLSDGEVHVDCTAPCVDAPADFLAVCAAIAPIYAELVAAGQRSDGPIQVVATRLDDEPPPATEVPWPLAGDVRDFSGGVTIADPQDIAHLHQVWNESRAYLETVGREVIRVRDVDGKLYAIGMVDLLPFADAYNQVAF